MTWDLVCKKCGYVSGAASGSELSLRKLVKDARCVRCEGDLQLREKQP